MTGKKFNGAPFGTQTSRFDVAGVHPQNKMPGTYTQAPYCKKATSKENKLLGPGTYTVETGDFTPRAIAGKTQGPNWERAQDMAKFNAIPHMLYRDQWQHKRDLVRLMGPGMYKEKDFIAASKEKPSSSRGVCQTGEPRLPRENIFLSNLPGPGTYGKGGVPWTAMEEKSKEAVSNIGSMESPYRDYYMPRNVGSQLAPCRYSFPGYTELMLAKKVSARGPYDLFSGDRYKIPQHLVEKRSLGPGKYDIKSTIEVWNDEHHQKHGEFSDRTQYPHQPTERIYVSTLSQCPRNKDDPGPGFYKAMTSRRRSRSAPSSQHPFNSSARRFDKRAQLFFMGNTNPVGTGQYDITRWNNFQHRKGGVNVFESKTPRLPPKVDAPRELLLNERIHPKGGSATRRPLVEVEVLEAPC